MRWSNLDAIRKHSRIDFCCDDSLLEEYVEAAEDTILEMLRRSETDLIDTYGKVPAAIRQATQLLVESSYNHRSPSSAQNLRIVPYGIDFLRKPYMIL